MSTPSRNLLLVAGLVALIAFGVYRLTLMPGIGLVDSGELTLAAWLPGNAHPPGTPLYVMLGWLFTRLPLGSVAARLNTMSAAFAALAAALIAVAAWLLRPRAESATWGAYLPPLVAGLTLACSSSLWVYAVVAEVYTVHLALLAGILAALFAWRRAPGALGARSNRWLYVAAALAGLAYTVHNVSVLTYVPAILFLVIGRDWPALRSGRAPARSPKPGKPSSRQARRERAAGGARPLPDPAPHAPLRSAARPRQAFLRVALISAACVAAGLLVYAYLPLRAAGRPLLNWGDPSSAETFWWHITGKWYQLFFETAQTTVPDRIARFFVLLAQQSFYLALAAVALGLWSLWRRDRALLVFLLLIVAGNLVLFAWYDTYQDQQAYVFPALPVLALLAGEGCAWLIAGAQRIAQAPRAAWAGAVMLSLAVPLVALAGNYAANDHSRDWLADDFGRNMLRGLEPRAVLLSSEWDVTISPLLYLQHVEGARPDVTVVDVNLMRRSWYVDFVRQADPALYAAVAPQYAAFLNDLVPWERGTCSRQCLQEIQGNFETLVNALVTQASAAGRPVYVTGEIDQSVTRSARPGLAVGPGLTRVPAGLAYRLYADAAFHPTPPVALELRGVADGTVPLAPGTVAFDQVPKLYQTMLVARAHYLRDGGDAAGAAGAYRQLLQVDPGNAEALAAVGK